VCLEEKPNEIEIDAAAIVVATGFSQHTPAQKGAYGYGVYKDVITALEFERMLSASGPTKGHVLRPSDGKVPKGIVFIQCVGSRDVSGRGVSYCSSFCCTYAIKDAILAREHEPGIESVSILHMDVRAYGKGFEDFYRRASEQAKVEFIRGRASKIASAERAPRRVATGKQHDRGFEDGAAGGGLLVYVEDTESGNTKQLPADLVVLSCAVLPSKGAKDLASVLGCEVDMAGFFKQPAQISRPLFTTREGIYVCGCASAPMDIPDSIAQASAAALLASSHVEGPSRPVEVHPSVSDNLNVEFQTAALQDPPRIGVFVCGCGLNIAGVIDTQAVADKAGKLENVAHAETMQFACSETAQRRIQETIRDRQLNRVVVAACTPRTHEPVFRRACADAGLNQYLFEMANIRDQCSWVHGTEKAEATHKAHDLVRMAVAKARRLQPLPQVWVTIAPRAVVVGGGIAGMHAACRLAERGIETYLIEKTGKLGGLVAAFSTLWPSGKSGSEVVDELAGRVKKSGARVLLNSVITEVKGFVGNFTVAVEGDRGRKKTMEGIGGLVLAIGAVPYEPQSEYGAGQLANVITSVALERMLSEGAEGGHEALRQATTVAFVQCVGSREAEGVRGCSRFCCDTTIKQALSLRKLGKNVVVFFRDIRSYAHGAEEMYRQARELGVRFLRFTPQNPPAVESDDDIQQLRKAGEGSSRRATAVTIRIPELDRQVTVPLDILVLAVGLRPRREDVARLGEMLKVPRSGDGFFMERHLKLGPVETAIEGVFACGTALGPKNAHESLSQAGAAAAKLGVLVACGRLEMEATTAEAYEQLCRGCGLCAEVCIFSAPALHEATELGYDVGRCVGRSGEKRRVARINPALCKGCGTCASLCPSGAIVAWHFTNAQITESLEALLLGNQP
jgi:heterodisulfide reductase subunit A